MVLKINGRSIRLVIPCPPHDADQIDTGASDDGQHYNQKER